jgi:imidazole glycerol-phosphate synthase subunit HisF
MLKRRLIPKLQMKRTRFGPGRHLLVTTIAFQKVIEIGDPISQAKIYESQSADELIFLDLDGTGTDLQPLVRVLEAVSKQIFMPITVGGGVRSVDDFRLLLSHGADKVSINTAAVEQPELITQASQRFGAQCVVVSMDCRRRPEGQYRVWTTKGKLETKWDPVSWAVECERRGAGEILLTSIDRDGSAGGLDIDLVGRVTTKVSIPVIASGGCGLASHFVAGFRAGADAVAAGTFFCFKDQNPMQTRAHLRNASIPIRLLT